MTHVHHTEGKGSHLHLWQGSFWYSSSKIAHRELSALKLHYCIEPFGWRNCHQEAPIKMAQVCLGLQIWTFFSSPRYLVHNFCKLWKFTQLYKIQPGHIQDPAKWLGRAGFQIQSCSPWGKALVGIRSACASFLDIYFPNNRSEVTILQRIMGKLENNHDRKCGYLF